MIINTLVRRTRLSKRTLSGGFTLTCGAAGWVTWCACDAAGSNLDGRSKVYGEGRSSGDVVKRSLGWFYEVYDEKVVHSSLFRFGRAAYVVISVFADYKYSFMGLTEENKAEVKSSCHLRSAVKLRDLCSLNGGVFMKIGQHIGSLEFLFPKEYTDTLRCFQYEAPQSPLEDIRYVIESDTGLKMSELFESFDEKPLGSASLAQVHKAVLKDGREVAVKVQHKAVKKHAFQDAKVIEFFVNVATELFPEFQFQWLVDQIKANLPLELDFLHEGKNCAKTRDILKEFPDIKVPEVYWKNSTNRVLFLEYIKGGIVDDMEYIKKNEMNVNDISVKLGQLYSEMIYVKGFIHCDPHPGNILIRKNQNGSQEVILLDHGLYLTMKDDVRLEYCKLWQSIIELDNEGIKKHSEALGVGEYYGLLTCIVTGRSWEAVQSGITTKHQTVEELREVQAGIVQYVPLITEILEKLPREMIMILKTNDLLRGLDARLKTKTASASFITMSKCCLRALYQHERTKCTSLYSRVRLDCRYFYDMSRMFAFQMMSSPFGKFLSELSSVFVQETRRFFDVMSNYMTNALYDSTC